MALKGKGLKINVSSDGETWNQVAELNDGNMTIDGDNIDVTAFCQDFINRIQGLKDGTYSLSGFYAPDDTNGQLLIRGALLDDDPIYIQFLPDGTSGFEQEVKVDTFDVSATVDGAVEVSIDLEGNGTITLATE